METFWWLDIVYFFVQTFIILISILILIGFIASLVGRSKEEFQIEITNVNKKYQKFKRTLDKNLHSPKDFKKILKSYKKIKSPDPKKPNVFVLEFSGDIQASANKQFREEVTACLLVAQKSDQVVVKVESPGGMVHGYGLATSQLHRIREQGIPLVVCVDQIAASGGYMMACVANKILAAPFSIIGSIGVVGSLPNFNRILKKNDIDYLEVTAGKHKRTLTPFGEITDEGMKKYKEQIQDVYELFKKHIKSQREKVDMDQVATGGVLVRTKSTGTPPSG